MSKLIDYPAATRFDSGDILIKDGMNGTKKITAKNAAIDLAGMVSAVQHRMIWGGRNLGTSVTAEQKAAISNSICQIISMSEKHVSECSLDCGLCLLQTFFVHLRSDITTLGCICIIHNMTV